MLAEGHQLPASVGESTAARPRRLAALAAGQRGRAAEVAERIFVALQREIPEYAGLDGGLGGDIRSVSAAGVEIWLDTVAAGRAQPATAFSAIEEGARRRARQGFDHHALLRAWRIAVNVMWSELVADPAARQARVREALPGLASLAMTLSDQLAVAVTRAYLEESARLARESERRRSVLLELILSHPEELRDACPAEISSPHLAVAVETDDLSLDELDRIGNELERKLHSTLWTVRRRSVVAIVPSRGAGARAELIRQLESVASRAGVRRIGIGAEASAPADARQSYLEAIDAMAIGSRIGRPGDRIHDFLDHASYALMLADPARARRVVARTLAPLAGLPAPWVLPTLEAYICRQGRLKEAAALLGVHANTVKYRLRSLNGSAAGVLADPARAAEMLAAIRLARLLPDPGSRDASQC